MQNAINKVTSEAAGGGGVMKHCTRAALGHLRTRCSGRRRVTTNTFNSKNGREKFRLFQNDAGSLTRRVPGSRVSPDSQTMEPGLSSSIMVIMAMSVV